MNKALIVMSFEEGQRTCPNCGKPLPAHDTWPGARFRYCGNAACTAELRKHDNGRYVAPHTVRCDADGCDKFVPEGFYGPYTSFLCCSSSCWRSRRMKRQGPVLCACGCEEHVQHRVRFGRNDRAYVSLEHKVRHERDVFIQNAFDVFRPIVEEYLTGFAVLHYRAPSTVRSSLARFFRYLNEVGIKSLDNVNCDTITQFLAWVHKNNRGVQTDLLSCISTFFKWLQVTGRRPMSSGNPVNSLLHRKKKGKRLPRPLSREELKLAWEFLLGRGDARLRLAFAIGEESGLRIGEICRLRVSDVDSAGRRLFVRLPTKNGRERYAHFGQKTAKYLKEWLALRDASCGHEMLLYNHSKQKAPFNTNSLGSAFSRVLCKTYRGKVIHDHGFEKWSTHRLRHTMGTRLVAGGADAAVVMAEGGWIDPDTMAGYVRVDEAQARHGYEMAMRVAEQQQQQAPRTRVFSLAEFSQRRERAVPAEVRHDEEIPSEIQVESHCV